MRVGESREVRPKRGRVSVPAVGRERERLAHDVVERGRQLGPHRARRGHARCADGLDGGERGAREEARAGDQLPEAHAERPHVDAPVERPVAQLLGGHVAERAPRLARAGGGDPPRGARDAEVGEASPAVEADEHVGGAHVAVHDAEACPVWTTRLVRVREPIGDVEGDRQRDLERHRAPRHDLGEIDPSHQLERDEGDPAVLAHVEQPRDAGVPERANQLGLFDQRVHHRGVFGCAREEALQRDRRATLAGRRTKDLAEGPHPNALEKVVSSKPLDARHDRSHVSRWPSCGKVLALRPGRRSTGPSS
jgi:hypothetical protein